MTYANDQWLLMPVKDLYDTQMMAMSIQAYKDMYEKGLKQLEDFNNKYGEFMSPFLKDMERYAEIVGGVKNMVNDALANGVDLTKSPEGRALLAKAINSVNPAEFNAMRANAKMGYAYLDAKAKLMAAGKYNDAQNDFFLRQQMGDKYTPFSEFSTAQNGSWDIASPSASVSLKDLTQEYFDKRTPYELTAQQAKEALGDAYDPRKTYKGWLYNDLYQTAGLAVPGMQGSWQGQYFRELAKQQVLSMGLPATEDNINKQLQRNVAEANREYIVNPIGDISDWAKQQNVAQGWAQINESKRHNQAMEDAKSGNGSGNKSNKEASSYGITLLHRGISKFAGSPELTNQGWWNARNTMVNINKLSEDQRIPEFLKTFGMRNSETRQIFQKRFDDEKGRIQENGSVNISKNDNGRIYTIDQIMTDVPGSKGERKHQVINEAYNKTSMNPTGTIVTIPSRGGSIKQFVEVTVHFDNGTDDTQYYLITETEPVATTSRGYNNTAIKKDIANQWSAVDERLNKLTGLGQGEVKSGTGYIVDDIENEIDYSKPFWNQ